MLFVDYNFDLLPNGSIRMDPELNPLHIGVHDGDTFVIRIQNGIVHFIKEDPEIGNRSSTTS